MKVGQPSHSGPHVTVDGLFRPPTERFQPDPSFNQRHDPEYRLLQNRLAWLVGCIALALPVVALLSSALSPWFGVPPCFRDSLSHYYYARGVGDVFVIGLAAIGTFLIAYRGESRPENALTWVAGIAALVVAAVPAKLSGCVPTLGYSGRLFDRWSQNDAGELGFGRLAEFDHYHDPFDTIQAGGALGWIDNLHVIAAGFLFAFLGWYCLRVMTRIVKERHFGDELVRKQRRNRWYLGCGATIWLVVAILLARAVALSGATGDDPAAHPFLLGTWNAWNLTFVAEWVAMWAFGLAWFIWGWSPPAPDARAVAPARPGPSPVGVDAATS